MIQYHLSSGIVDALTKVKHWDNAGFIGIPFLLHYAILSIGPEFAKHDQKFAFDLDVVWYENNGDIAVVSWDKDNLLKKAKILLAKLNFLKKKYN